jgi:hypothetical protein
MTDFVGGGPRCRRFPSLATLIDVGPVWGVLLRGCLTENRSRDRPIIFDAEKRGPEKRGRKLGAGFHEHFLDFRDAIFQMPAGEVGNRRGQKKHHAFSPWILQHTIFRDATFPDACGRGGNRRGQKTARIVRYQAICPLQDRRALGRAYEARMRRPLKRLMQL